MAVAVFLPIASALRETPVLCLLDTDLYCKQRIWVFLELLEDLGGLSSRDVDPLRSLDSCWGGELVGSLGAAVGSGWLQWGMLRDGGVRGRPAQGARETGPERDWRVRDQEALCTPSRNCRAQCGGSTPPGSEPCKILGPGRHGLGSADLDTYLYKTRSQGSKPAPAISWLGHAHTVQPGRTHLWFLILSCILLPTSQPWGRRAQEGSKKWEVMSTS